MSAGTLVVFCGPSGAGKDALADQLARRLDGQVHRAHRYITRPPGPGEPHVPLSPAAFAARQARGLFALSWQAHGCAYGLGIEIDAWLAAGLVVAATVSRAVLREALARYPLLVAVHVDAPAHVRAARLAQRGRDGDQAPGRATRVVALPDLPRLVEIDNGGALADAGERLVRALRPLLPPLREVVLPSRHG